MNLPCGFRFSPTDGELIFHYMAEKVFGRALAVDNDIISEIDVYEVDPHQLPLCEKTYANDKEEYYFTTTEPTKRSERANTIRFTKHGYWKQIEDDAFIMHKEEIVGFKKEFIFCWGHPPFGLQTRWVMRECRLISSGFPNETLDDSVLDKIETNAICRLRKRADDYVAAGDESPKYVPKRSWLETEN